MDRRRRGRGRTLAVAPGLRVRERSHCAAVAHARGDEAAAELVQLRRDGLPENNTFPATFTTAGVAVHAAGDVDFARALGIKYFDADEFFAPPRAPAG